MLAINMDDVMKVLTTIKPHLIALGIVLALAIIVTVAAGFIMKKKAARSLTRKSAWIAMLLVIVIVVNLIITGPMNTMVALATGSGTIKEQTSAKATELVEKISEEGIALFKNQDNILPLAKNSKVNVFGWASTNPCYGGTGSGALSDAYPTTTLLQGLTNAGFEYNTELSDMYTKYRADRPEVGMWSQDWTLPEPTEDYYTDDLMNKAKSFSDTAIVVVSRVGGEGADVPTDVSKVTYTDNSKDYKDFEAGEHYLQLSATEKKMLDKVTSNFDKVIFIYNSSNPMEIGFVNEYPQIKGCLWVAGPGQSGFNALGKVLDGEVNPSARTVDTWVADLTQTPNWNNFGSFTYNNMDKYAYTSKPFGSDKEVTQLPTFVNYVEGIYVGYKFWETAATEGFIDYDKSVVYPFGYGLSYTSFDQKMSDITVADGKVSFDVTVTNTGSVAGKDVVEVYFNPPYTEGGIEKASANLIAFEKTDLLEPGASTTAAISLNLEDMASYDISGDGQYVLEKGDYVVSINKDSHNIIESKKVNVADTVTYSGDNKRSTDLVTATNKFPYASGELTYLSRAGHFANYAEATKAPSEAATAETQEKFLNNGAYDVTKDVNESDVMPTTGAKNGIKLEEMRGLDFEDAKWDKFLDQLTIGDMDSLIALGGYSTTAVSDIGKVMTYDCDGPASINNNFTKVGSVGFPSATMIASTWSTKLADAFGDSIGEMANQMNVSGWYAPAMNIHRSSFAGRNFEYYSEDGLLSGKMAANAVIGAARHGVYAYIKHFAMNDQETNRTNMLCTWSNEQAMREIYLKPFEIAVKQGGAHAVMSSFNYIGYRWAGANPNLLVDVLRNEWGFKGFVLTDYFGVYGYMNSDISIRNGGDSMLVNYDTATNHLADKESATALTSARRATKDILYTVVNSRAYDKENLHGGLKSWQIMLICGDIVAGLLIVCLCVLSIKSYRKHKDDEVAVTIEK